MKVTNTKQEPVDVAGLSRSKKNEKAAGLKKGDSAIANSVGPGDAAAVDLSSDAKAFSHATKAAKSDDIDQAKVDRLKEMINGGKYKPDFGKVADKLVNEQLLQEMS